jgi:hypothetical protein
MVTVTGNQSMQHLRKLLGLYRLAVRLDDAAGAGREWCRGARGGGGVDVGGWGGTDAGLVWHYD